MITSFRIVSIILALLSTVVFTHSIGCGGGGGGGESTSPVQLIRPDGTTLSSTDTPIPLGSLVRIPLVAAVTDETERDAIVALLAITDPDGNAVAGSWAWNETFTTITFTPAGRFDYQTEYTVNTSATGRSTMNATARYVVILLRNVAVSAPPNMV